MRAVTVSSHSMACISYCKQEVYQRTSTFSAGIQRRSQSDMADFTQSRELFSNRPISCCAAQPACSKRMVPSRNVAAATRLECSIVQLVSLPQIAASLCLPGLFDVSACGLKLSESSILGSILSMVSLGLKGVMASVVRLQGAADFTCALLLRRPCWS